MVITETHKAGFSTAPAAIRDTFLKLESEHIRKYASVLVSVCNSGQAVAERPEEAVAGEEDPGNVVPEELQEFDDEVQGRGQLRERVIRERGR